MDSHRAGLEFEARFTGGVGQGFYFAVVFETAAVENHFGDVFGSHALSDELADLGRGGDVGAVRFVATELSFSRYAWRQWSSLSVSSMICAVM